MRITLALLAMGLATGAAIMACNPYDPNLGNEPFRVTRGMRIAQLVFARFERVAFRPADELPPSDRGAGGFGSTGH